VHINRVDDDFFNLIIEFQDMDWEDCHDYDFWENKKENLYKKILLDKKSSNSFKEEIQLIKALKEGIDDPVKPGILKDRLGKLSCSKVRAAKAELKDKGTHYAKALQRYLNYHCQ
jgi:negative regulator of genetic competence, sporulation and motility